MSNNITEKFVGKIVAIRGIGSGVNVGRLVVHQGTEALLEAGSFFCKGWKYDEKKSHGAFHSLSTAQVHPKDGEITRVKGDTVITDVAQMVVCDEALVGLLDGQAKD
jgi:hypothetical protein